MPAPHEHILNIVMGFWQSRALAVATELELADFLADGPLPADTLASLTKTDASSLYRLMRALESIGVFKQGVVQDPESEVFAVRGPEGAI